MAPSVILIGPAHPLRGGLASFNERLARQCMAESMPTELWTFSLQYPAFLFPGSTQFSAEPAPEGLSIRVCINSVNPFNWIRTGIQLMRKRPDVIVVRYWLPFMGPCLGTILRIAKMNRHSRVICIADNMIPHEPRPGDRLFTRYFVRPVDGFITMSRKVFDDLRSFTGAPARTLNHPLYDNFGEQLPASEARRMLHLDPDQPVLLFFGFVRKYKGIDLLFEALHLLKNEGFFNLHPLKCVVAGEFYDDPEPYRALLAQYALTDIVIMRNEFITDSEVKYYLSAASCVIQPYRNATQSGVTPLAYHFEKPMIVTNVGGLPGMVPEGVGLVAEPVPKSIAEKIRTFFEGDPLRFRERIREEKQQYAWSNLTAAIRQLAAPVND